MEYILNELNEDYKRTKGLVKDDPFVGDTFICFDDVLRAHYLVVDFFIALGQAVIPGVRSVAILGSALGRQTAGLAFQIKWKKPEEICATLFYGLIKDHPFHDANKRTSILVLLLHLYKFRRTITASQKDFECLALDIASGAVGSRKKFRKFRGQDDAEVQYIADFLHGNTREIDKRYYPVTYQELDRLLKQHKCYLDNPHDNYIDVMQMVEKGFFRKSMVPRKVLKIGFPGWKKQVNHKALKEVLKATHLTAEHGIDSQVFFKDADPLAAFIDEYKSLLWRLRNK